MRHVTCTLLASLVLASAALGSTGCAAQADGDENVRSLRDPGEATGDVREDEIAAPGAAAPAPVYPPRADLPIGSSAAEACAFDEAAAKKAFYDHLAAIGAKPNTTNKVVHEGNVAVCRYCDLSGKEIKLYSQYPTRFEDSYLAGARLVGIPLDVQLKNVDARGLWNQSYVPATAMTLENVDMRCGRPGNVTVRSARNVDFSGSADLSVLFNGLAEDVRFTGVTRGGIGLSGGTLNGARFDGFAGGVTLDSERVSGDLLFDKASGFWVTAKDVTFQGGSISSVGAHGTMGAIGSVTFDGTDLSRADGGFRLTAGASSVHTTRGAKWPVGKGGLVNDDELRGIDLTGAALTAPGEVWAPSNLDGLRLAHGALPSGADLSKASLVGASLQGVDFTAVKLSSAGTRGTSGAKLVGAHLATASMPRVEIDAVDFTGADLRGADLSGVRGRATFDRATAGALAPHTDENKTADRIDTMFANAELGASTFVGTQLQYADFHFARLADASFERAVLDWADFTNARFFRTGTSGDVWNTSLSKAASVHAVSMDGADLRRVDLSKLDFGPFHDPIANTTRRASFDGAILCGADLSGAVLSGARLTNAYFDVQGPVVFPDGTKGTCEVGKRAGADTLSTAEAITSCPDGTHATALGCTDAQWHISTGPANQCTDTENAAQRANGERCAKDCECASNFCATNGTCRNKRAQ